MQKIAVNLNLDAPAAGRQLRVVGRESSAEDTLPQSGFDRSQSSRRHESVDDDRTSAYPSGLAKLADGFAIVGMAIFPVSQTVAYLQ